jgi:hypothetical protein
MTRRWAASFFLLLLASCTENRVGSHKCIGGWRPLFEDLDRVVLAVGGTSERDVYLVGGGLGFPGKNALVVHFDGIGWRELVNDRPETIWWVHAVGRDDVWMVGDDGLALHWDGTSFLRVPTRTHATLFGAWGSSSDDVWFVGGKPGAGEIEDNEVLLHWDGTRISKEAAFPQKGRALFKVFSAGDDVWVSGESGSLWNRREGVWRDHSGEVSVLTSPFSLTGCSSRELYAVGGKSVYAYDGSAWRLESDASVGTIAIGAACGAESLFVVGSGGMKLRYDKRSQEWFDEQDQVPWDTDFHGAWIAPDGSIWAGGGNFLTPAALASRRVGVVGYRGCEDVPTTIGKIVPVRVDEYGDEPTDAGVVGADGGNADGGDGGVTEDATPNDPDAGMPPDAEPIDGGEEEDAGFEPDATPDAGCNGPAIEPLPGDLVINEVLADPAPVAPDGDANRDGVRDAVEDEFVEIVNVSSSPLELVDVVVSDTVGIRHVFGPTRLGCGQAVVVFGGGDPQNVSWQPNWTVSSEGALGLNNDGDRVELGIYNFGDIASLVFGSEAETDQSMVRSSDLDGAAPMIPHTSAPFAEGRRFSPGFRTDGSNF